MVKISVKYEGNLHCQAVHGSSGSIIETDAPLDNEGRGELFSPTDLVATALATCIATVVGIYARRKQWNFNGMRVECNKEMSKDSPRRIITLTIDVWIPMNLTAEERAKVEHVAYSCPVHKSLHPDIHVPIVIHWP